jgi:hypothetical protein
VVSYKTTHIDELPKLNLNLMARVEQRPTNESTSFVCGEQTHKHAKRLYLSTNHEPTIYCSEPSTMLHRSSIQDRNRNCSNLTQKIATVRSQIAKSHNVNLEAGGPRLQTDNEKAILNLRRLLVASRIQRETIAPPQGKATSR